MNEFKPKRIMRTWIKKQLPKWKTLSNDFKQSNEKKKNWHESCQIYKLSNEIEISQQKTKKKVKVQLQINLT